MEYYFAYAAVTSVISSQKQAAMMRQQADAAEKQGEISIQVAEFQAKQARIQGEQQATFLQRESERKVGQMVATTGASGTELKGSPIVVIGNQIYSDQMAVANTMSNASAKARSIEAAGMAENATDQMKGASLRASAGITEEAGWLSAIASGISAYGAYSSRTGGPADKPPEDSGFANWYAGQSEGGGPGAS